MKYIGKFTKKIYFILFLLSIFFINIDNAYAEGEMIDISDTKSDSGNTSASGGNVGNSGTETTGGTADTDWYKAVCSWEKSTSSSSQVYGFAYDTEGNYIGKITNINYESLAGRFIGLNIYETKNYTTTIKYSLISYRIKYTCNKYCAKYAPPTSPVKPPVKPPGNAMLMSYSTTESTLSQLATTGRPCIKWEYNKTTYNIESCPNKVSNAEREYRTPTEKAWCDGIAKSKITTSQVSPSYEVTYLDSNDINTSTQTNDKYNTQETVKGTVNCTNNQNGSGLDCGGGTCSGTITSKQNCTISYNRSNTICINVKTGKIRYANQNECNDEEYAVTNSQNYWSYFIPLNAKSDSRFGLTMKSGSKQTNANICKNIIDNYDNYRELITYKPGELFPTDESKAKSKSKVDNGCYYQTYVNIPITQKFYNEEKNNNNQIIFKGFNFYYRAIDINNPFPNGIAADSYWYEWGQSQKANQNPNPDLSESFATKTYETKNISASAVREYNEEHPYTSWDEMNTNGSSSLINSNKISNTLIERIVNNKDYYNLGCGPANKDWEECR